MARETTYDLYFPAVAYYDGQGFMVPAARKIDFRARPQRQQVCVSSQHDNALNLADYFPRQQHQV